jgi:hypothetical protein
MRGVFPLAVELWTFGSPGGLRISNFSKCWASPPTLGQSRGATSTMKTSAKVRMLSTNNTMLTCQCEESKGGGKTCVYSRTTWKFTPLVLEANVLWRTSWDAIRSLPWEQHNRWIPIGSKGWQQMQWVNLNCSGWGMPNMLRIAK